MPRKGSLLKQVQTRAMEIIRAGIFQFGEVKISMRLYKKGGNLKENGGKQFSRAFWERKRGNGCKPKIGGFKLDIRKKVFFFIFFCNEEIFIIEDTETEMC